MLFRSPVEIAAKEVKEIYEAPAMEFAKPEIPKPEEIIRRIQAVDETPKQEEETKDEFPPNQWKTPPTFSKKPRRIITESSTGENVQMRPRNPYKD